MQTAEASELHSRPPSLLSADGSGMLESEVSVSWAEVRLPSRLWLAEGLTTINTHSRVLMERLNIHTHVPNFRMTKLTSFKGVMDI